MRKLRLKPKERFDPSKGQKMGYREWAATHTGGNKKSRYKRAMGKQQGEAWQRKAKGKFGKDHTEVTADDVSKSRRKQRRMDAKERKGKRLARGIANDGGPASGGTKAPTENRSYKKALGGKKSTWQQGVKYRKARGLALTPAMKKKMAAAAKKGAK